MYFSLIPYLHLPLRQFLQPLPLLGPGGPAVLSSHGKSCARSSASWQAAMPSKSEEEWPKVKGQADQAKTRHDSMSSVERWLVATC